MKKTTLPLLLLLLLTMLGVAACGGDDGGDSSSAASATDSVIGGGSAVCDQATFDTWVEEFGKSNGTTATLPEGGFTCADGWAVLTPDVADGSASFTETVVVQAEGPVWALMDRDMVCGDSEDSAEVPASLYKQACQTS